MPRRVVFATPLGDIAVSLLDDVAPEHCRVFSALAQGGTYTGCCVYRAEPGFVVQGGLRTQASQVDHPLNEPGYRQDETNQRWNAYLKSRKVDGQS